MTISDLFVLREDLRGQPGGQHVVDILQETLLLDVLIREEEGGLVPADAAVAEENLEVLDEVGEVVGTCDGDLESLVGADEGGELGETLFATSAHSHLKQG